VGVVNRRSLAAAALLVLAAAACTQTRIPHPKAGQVTVVATTTQMQDLVRNVGGRDVRMVGILEPNVDPHDFEPTPSTAIALSGAQLVVESGAGLDRWTAGLVSNSVPGTPIWVASAGLPLRGDDPHWWFDPTLFERAATDLGDRLGRLDPAHASAYRARAQAYALRIRAMDAANRRLIATVPPAKRLLVTNHDAFGYFAAYYGIRVVGFSAGNSLNGNVSRNGPHPEYKGLDIRGTDATGLIITNCVSDSYYVEPTGGPTPGVLTNAAYTAL